MEKANEGFASSKDTVLTPESLEAVELLLQLIPMVRLVRGRGGNLPCAVAGHPVTPRNLHVILELVFGGAMSVSEVAERIDVNLASASLTVTQLDHLGLVERRDDPLDHRRTIVVPTVGLGQFVTEVLATRVGPLTRALARMDAGDRVTLGRLVDQLGASVREELRGEAL
ncbi:MAG: MarR family winged helix-turn-helix transcriptional regulator [Ferrimicrobium sp.]